MQLLSIRVTLRGTFHICYLYRFKLRNADAFHLLGVLKGANDGTAAQLLLERAYSAALPDSASTDVFTLLQP